MVTVVIVAAEGIEEEEEEVGAAAAVEEERRARLLRVVGPEGDDDEEGAVEEASARFRLRVSIQRTTAPQFDGSLGFGSRARSAIRQFPMVDSPASENRIPSLSNQIEQQTTEHRPNSICKTYNLPTYLSHAPNK